MHHKSQVETEKKPETEVCLGAVFCKRMLLLNRQHYNDAQTRLLSKIANSKARLD